MRRRPGPATWRESRRFRQAHQKLAYVGLGVVDCIVYDLGKKIDALVDLLGRDGAKPDHQRPPVEQGWDNGDRPAARKTVDAEFAAAPPSLLQRRRRAHPAEDARAGAVRRPRR